jgi:DNA polymerase V
MSFITFKNKPKNLFALVDCNNFFASCERVFNPKFNNQPLIVLSNNGGCVIARSNEAKALGIKMGQPFFELRDLMAQQKVHVRSSNFALYGDLSERIMTILQNDTPNLEVYSIDEAFLDFSDLKADKTLRHAHKLRKRIYNWIGIPTSIGIGTTKTLAKIASHVAKKYNKFNGVYQLPSDHKKRQKVFKHIHVRDIWGIGRKYDRFLTLNGIETAAQFNEQSHSWIRKHMGLVGLRIAMELQGTSCIPLDDAPAPKKSIMVSRSFKHVVTNQQDMSEALSCFGERAIEKLRYEKLCAHNITLFMRTNPHNQTDYTNCSLTMRLPVPSNSTGVFLNQISKGIPQLFHNNKKYKKAGIILTELVPENQVQGDLFYPQGKQQKLMATVDNLNKKMGRNTLFYGTSSHSTNWHSTSELCSPYYTTDWNDLLQIAA